ncbi:MAG: hypothetical protein JSU86_00815 [Phycisphaerales bacterium]|nr:MAG: hypothetical protein JSU86_00815 [Phycisphaerales bacterium]
MVHRVVIIILTVAAIASLSADMAIRFTTFKPRIAGRSLVLTLPIRSDVRIGAGIMYRMEFHTRRGTITRPEFGIVYIQSYPEGAATPARQTWEAMGFGYDAFTSWPLGAQGAQDTYERVMYCQLWYVGVVLAFCPSITFVRGSLQCRRRQKRGLCVKCGYNLTGLPEPRCPECGTPIESTQGGSDDVDT